MKFKDKKVLFCLMLFFLIIISISNVSANNLNDVNIDNFTSISYDSIDAIEYDVESDGNQIFDNSLNHEELLEIGDDDVIITSDNFGSYFNDGIYNGTEDTIYFEGNFSENTNLVFNNPINIIGLNGNNFYDMPFKINGNNSNMTNINLVLSNSDISHNYAGIYVSSGNVKLDNLKINFTVPLNTEGYGIFVDNANNFKLLNSNIQFIGNNKIGLIYNYGLKIKNSHYAFIYNNIINASLPLRAVDFSKPFPSTDTDLVLSIGVQSSNYLNFIRNNVYAIVNDAGSDFYPTLDCFMMVDSNNSFIDYNNFTEIDTFTPSGSVDYLYVIDIYKLQNATISNNNVLVTTLGGAGGNGTAYPIQITGLAVDILICDNNLTALCNGPCLGIYSQNYYGITSLEVCRNNVNVSGRAGTHNYALVSGMEFQDTYVNVYSNIINVNAKDLAVATTNVNIYGISYSQITSGSHTYNIYNNTVSTNGYYAVYLYSAINSNVTSNRLQSNKTEGDASVKIVSGSNNVIFNNTGISSSVSNNYNNEIKLMSNLNFSGCISENSNILGNSNYNQVYVSVEGRGDGKSSDNPTNLTNALDNLENNTIVHIADGLYVFEKTYSITATNVTIQADNKGKAIFSGNKTRSMFSIKDTADNFIFYNLSFINGKSSANKVGGAISANVEITLNNCIFENNQASKTYGGAIYSIDNLNIIDSIFKSNSASKWGGGAIYSTGDMTVINSTFLSNTAGRDGGGAIFGKGDLNIYKTDFISNTAASKGGCIVNNLNLNIFDCNFINSSLKYNGYGSVIYSNVKGNTSIMNSNFSGNVKSYSVYLMYSKTNITNSIFDNNNGGAFYMGGGTTAMINNCSFKNNFAQDGGAVYAVNDNPTFNNCIFINNSATNAGAFMGIQAGNSILNNCIFIDNFASNNGGAVIFKTWSGGILNNCTFINNSAKNMGGAIYWATSGGISNSSKFIGNDAKEGGAIFSPYIDNAFTGRYPTLINSTFTDNIATANGGALSMKCVEANVTYCNFTNNIAQANGGSIYWESYYLGVKYNPTISYCNFEAKDNNYVIYNNKELYLVNNTINADFAIYNNGIIKTPITFVILDNQTKSFPNDDVRITAVLLDDNNNHIVGGKLQFIFNNTNVTSTIENGMFLYVFSTNFTGLMPVSGYYDVLNADNVTIKNGVLHIKLSPSIGMNLSTNTSFVDETVVAKINLSPDMIKGTVTIMIDGKDYTVVSIDNNHIFTVNITGLTYGDHVISALYSGDNDYGPKMNSSSITVFRVSDYNMSVIIDEVSVGEDAIINVSLPRDANGNVTVTLDGVDYTGVALNGTALVYIPNLPIGKYNITIAYLDDKYASKTINGTITVVKNTHYNMDINVEDVKVGEEAIINIELPSDATGSVELVIGNITQSANIKNGKASVSIGNLSAGQYTATIQYNGDNKYGSAKATASFNVTKLESKVDISVDNIEIGKDAVVTVSVTSGATGNVTFTVGDKTETVGIKDGKATLTVKDLASGDYTVSAVYNGDDKYLSSSNSTSFKVSKLESKVDISVDNIEIGKDAVVTVSVTSGATGNVTVVINGKSQVVELKDSKATVTIENLTAEDYKIEATYNGDAKYLTSSAVYTFNVNKLPSSITVSADDIKVGEDAVIVASVISGATGNVTFTIGDKTETVEIKDGKATLTVKDLVSGDYTVSAVYNGDAKYLTSSNSTSFKVSKISGYDIKVNVGEVNEGENATVTVILPKDATGNVTLVMNNRPYFAKVNNGTAKVIIPYISAGTHEFIVTYYGDNKYDKATANGTITVNKKTFTLTADNLVKYYKGPESLTAKLVDSKGNPIAGADVTFNINGKDYIRKTNNEGIASMAINLGAGTYNVAVKYNESSVNATVTVKSTIMADNLVKMYQNATRFYAKFLDSTGKALTNSEVKFNINGVFYTKTTDKDGVADMGIALRPGNYILTAYNLANGEEKGVNITVKSLIVQSDLTKYYLNASKFQATVYNKDGSLAVGKNVTFNINGVFYTKTTDSNGVASLGIALRPGEYTITTMFEGLDIGNKVNVLPTLVTKDLSMKYLDGSNFTALTLDGQGKPLANQNVSFNVNGVFYHKVTNKDGIASLGIRLMSGEYIITSYWNDFQTGNTIKISP